MRRILPLLIVVVLLLPACAFSQRACTTIEYNRSQPASGPVRRPVVNDVVNGSAGGGTGLDVIIIPVVVHVIYHASAENISDAQVQSQINVLNRDYGRRNADSGLIPTYYRDLAADCGIRFVLANVDTAGATCTGILRKRTAKTQFTTDDAIKHIDRGGDDGWDRDRYLNIWVGRLPDGVLGYASAPGCEKSRDGVVIDYRAFGTTGTVVAPFHLGRTATHEIGHWLNLIHVWGDEDCGDDEVDDTPRQSAATHGNPSGMVFSCGNTPYGNLYMDFMDLTDDVGMHLFTYGQRDRIRSLFLSGGARYAMLSSTGHVGSLEPIEEPVAKGGGDWTIKVYPNPGARVVQVAMDQPLAQLPVLAIFNAAGQRVMEVRPSQSSFSLDISALPAGLYFIRSVDGSAKVQKLMKM